MCICTCTLCVTLYGCVPWGCGGWGAQEGMVRKFTVVGSEVTDVNGTYTENGKTDG